MAIRNVIQIGDPLLKLKNKYINNVTAPYVKQLIQDLIDTMKHKGLIGIAAPQIGENYQVFITHPTNTKYRKLGKGDTLRVYINPTLSFKSKKECIIYEGCGCVPGINEFGPVMRPKEIKVTAQNTKGKKFTLKCDGILARVIQHEMDHLKGIEFVDKISDPATLVSRKYYLKNIKYTDWLRKASQITKIEYKLIKE